MQRGFVAAALGLAVLVSFTANAVAVAPQKGSVLIGDIKSSPFVMHVNIGVNSSGTSAHFTYLCGTGRAPTTVYNMPIDATGHFKITKLNGSAVVWKMAGHFVTPTTAFVSLNSIACGGSKGSTTLRLKT
jgi:hypothetical protein